MFAHTDPLSACRPIAFQQAPLQKVSLHGSYDDVSIYPKSYLIQKLNVTQSTAKLFEKSSICSGLKAAIQIN